MRNKHYFTLMQNNSYAKTAPVNTIFLTWECFLHDRKHSFMIQGVIAVLCKKTPKEIKEDLSPLLMMQKNTVRSVSCSVCFWRITPANSPTLFVFLTKDTQDTHESTLRLLVLGRLCKQHCTKVCVTGNKEGGTCSKHE